MKRFSLFLLLTLTVSVYSYANTFTHETPSYNLHFHITNDSFDPYTVELDSVQCLLTDEPIDIEVDIPESVPYQQETYFVTTISAKAFKNNTNHITSVLLPCSIHTIEEETFSSCHNLASIAIPNSITSIGKHAFHGTNWYNKLPNGAIYINNILYTYKGNMLPNTAIKVKEGTTQIVDAAFQDCKNLTGIALPQSLLTIGKCAFKGCSSLTSVAVPKNIRRIEDECFANCTALAFVLLPKGLFYIGNEAFSNCKSLTSITIPHTVNTIGGAASYEYAWRPTNDNTFYIRYKRVAGSVFKNCTSLVSVTIPEGVRRIDNNAFEGCTALRTIRIPNSVYAIGEAAFKDCNALTDIQFGDSLRYVGYKAFHTTPWYENLPDGEVYIGKTLYAYKGKMKTSTSITIQDHIISITKGAFAGCTKLTDIRFPNTIRTIEDSAFYGCWALSTIMFPNSLHEIGWMAFKDCHALDSICFSDSLTTVGWEAFQGTSWHQNQPNGVVYIHDIAYSYHGKMPRKSSVELKEGTRYIAPGAFLGQSNLCALTLPQTIQELDCFALYKCSSLDTITCLATIPPICGAKAFEEKIVYKNVSTPLMNVSVPHPRLKQICIYVPNNAVAEYKQDVDWRKFTQIKGIVQETE